MGEFSIWQERDRHCLIFSWCQSIAHTMNLYLVMWNFTLGTYHTLIYSPSECGLTKKHCMGGNVKQGTPQLDLASVGIVCRT